MSPAYTPGSGRGRGGVCRGGERRVGCARKMLYGLDQLARKWQCMGWLDQLAMGRICFGLDQHWRGMEGFFFFFFFLYGSDRLGVCCILPFPERGLAFKRSVSETAGRRLGSGERIGKLAYGFLFCFSCLHGRSLRVCLLGKAVSSSCAWLRGRDERARRGGKQFYPCACSREALADARFVPLPVPEAMI